ncbi:MAG TPA: tetratricopeptide repeat protein [Bacteroidota bacterium]|nr:tetratricopeptide repeat protein [Bacteroidota bacterium]
MRFRLWLMMSAVILLAGCRKPSADELMQNAESTYARAEASADSVRAGGDIKAFFQPSIAAYEKVIAEYPGTPQAERALYLLATIRNNDTHEPQLAIDAYRRYLAAFPEGAQAPSALFLIGFIYNNELHALDSAAAAYHEFLSRFPQDEMASSAQYELDHLGKSPEDSLPDTTAQPPEASGRGRARQSKTM